MAKYPIILGQVTYDAGKTADSKRSERISHRKMKRKISFELRMNDGIAFRSPRGIDGLHATVTPKHKEIQIETHSYSVSHSYLFIKRLEVELAARLVNIVAKSPNVSGINESRPSELPEQAGAVLNAGIQLDVSCLIQKIIVARKGPRSQITD